MRSRLLVSAAILVAGLAAASSQNALGSVGQDHHNGSSNGRHDGHIQLRNQNRSAMGAAAPKLEPPLRTRATGSGSRDSTAGTGANPHGNPHAIAKRHAETSPGPMSQRARAPAKPSDASVLSPRAQSGLEQDRIGQGDRSGRNRAQTRLQRRQPALALPKERGEQNLARNKPPPDQGMGRADERALRGARIQASSRMASRAEDHRGGAPGAPRDEIRKAQAALNQQGFSAGDADGRLGRRTKEALIAFQKQRGVQTTGKLDRTTRDALFAGGVAPAGSHDRPGSSQPSPAQAGPQGVGAGTTGQGSAPPQPATDSPEPVEGETPPATEGLPLPDSGASGRVPAGSPQEDYKDDTPAADQR